MPLRGYFVFGAWQRFKIGESFLFGSTDNAIPVRALAKGRELPFNIKLKRFIR